MSQHLKVSQHDISVHLGIWSLPDKAVHTQPPSGSAGTILPVHLGGGERLSACEQRSGVSLPRMLATTSWQDTRNQWGSSSQGKLDAFLSNRGS